jgi:rubrerythrin
MTNKEAIETIQANYPDERYTMLREALDIAIEALEKQESFEPVEMIDDFYPIGDPLRTIGWRCGKCGERIAGYDNYCPNCGKAVKWE